MTFGDPKSAAAFKGLLDNFDPERALQMWREGDSADGRLTVAGLAERFLSWKARDVTPRTMADYRRDYANWIAPAFGRRPAETVDELDVQRWVDDMATKLAPKSVADRHMLLHSIYQYGKARSRRLVNHNPCTETDLPKKTRKPPKGTTVPEFRAILDAARPSNPDAADLIEYLGETGWRFSEAAALPARAVEDDGEHVWVTVVQVFRIVDNRQVLAPDAAKSWAGFRRIRLFPESAATVRRRVVGKRPDDFVFLNSRGRHWNQNTWLRSTWPSIIAAANLGEGRKPTPHWLRHMHVAVCAAAGAPMQEIQRRIGHESIETTNSTYGGMIGDVSDETLLRANDIIGGRRSAPVVAPVVVGEVVPKELGG